MRCKHCDARLAVHDFWCSNCGHQTPVVNKELSALASLKRTWQACKALKGSNAPAGAFAVLLGLLPLAVALIVLRSFGVLDLAESQNAGTLLLNLFLISVSLAIFLPTILLPFNPVCKEAGHRLTWKAVTAALRHYPRYLFLAALIAVYYSIIYLICFGLPNFGSDPILRLVWIVLLNYFVAVALPVPVLMERKGINAWQALRLSYRHFHVARWQLFLLALVLAVLNSLAALLLVVPLLVTLPLSWFAIRDYTDLLLEYEIVREAKQDRGA